MYSAGMWPLSKVTPCCSMSRGRAWTWSCLRRWPQIDTFATPGTRSRRDFTVVEAIIDRSSREIVFDESPMCITRLVADLRGSICGGEAQVGSVGVTVCRRSCTSCLACSSSVPGLNWSVIDDSWPTDCERIVSGNPSRSSRLSSIGVCGNTTC